MRLLKVHGKKPHSHLDAIANLHSGQYTSEDIQLIIDRYADELPYLKYCQMEQFDFTDVEATVEVVGVIKKLVSKGAAKAVSTTSSILKSKRFIPKFTKWLGLGESWGEMIGFFAFDALLAAGLTALSNLTNLNPKGISDLGGIKAKRALLGEDATFKLRAGVWAGQNLDFDKIADTLNMQVAHISRLLVLSTGAEEVMRGTRSIDDWLNTVLKGKPSTGFIAKHRNRQAVLIKTEDGYKVDKAPLKEGAATICYLPQTQEYRPIQAAGRALTKAADSFSKKMDKLLAKLAKIETDVNGNAAYTLLEALAVAVNATNKDMAMDTAELISDAISNTISPPKTAENEPEAADGGKTVQVTKAPASASKPMAKTA